MAISVAWQTVAEWYHHIRSQIYTIPSSQQRIFWFYARDLVVTNIRHRNCFRGYG